MSEVSSVPRPLGRVLYVQYANPAAYPPVEHGAHLVARAGFDVRVLGLGYLDRVRFRPHPRIRVEMMRPAGGGMRGRLRYLQYMSWVAWRALRWSPDWIYASDPFACPAALSASAITGARIIYHEHDSPAPADRAGEHWFARQVRQARARIANRAAICILPNARRARAFAEETGRRDPACVWNCPLADEVAESHDAPGGGSAMRLLYHGSIVPARLPLTVIDALGHLPGDVSLSFAGYETAGHPGYIQALLRRADQQGVRDRVRYAGLIPTREELLRHGATCDVGLALLVPTPGDLNEEAMAGASNKPFDYLARGLALVVSDLPDWREMFVTPGFGMTADPASAESIAAVLRWLFEHPSERRAMAEHGRQKMATAWNYDTLFAPVLAAMRRPASPQSSPISHEPARS